MCNEAARQIALGEIAEGFAELRIPLEFPEGLPNLAPTESVRITDVTPIVRMRGAGAELVQRRWSWPGRGGRPVYNYRSEGRDFANGERSGRCLIPFDGFYEFTTPETPPGGPKPKRKNKWYFSPAPESVLGEAFLCIAGLWRTDPEVGEAFTMLTCAPGPDVAPYHGRQVVLMPRGDWQAWLAGEGAASELIAPAPQGSLNVSKVAR
jgi:putative SOS response-associated peptidase YedK